MSELPPARSAQHAGAEAISSRSKHTGKRLGKFQIVGELGRGGMGVVFEALDTVLDRRVAIKLLPRSVAEQPLALKRFLREAQGAARLQHVNVVAVYEADQANGQYYLVLELVRGGSLQDALRRGPLTWQDATQAMIEACRGLVAAHRAGLVHRDIKPANLMRTEEGVVKLADFGLALESTADASATGSGAVLGTPQFMSPEQCRSETADERSDVYSMGATYFALLTGRVPFLGTAPLLVMNSHLLDPIPDPRELDPTIPAACAAIVFRAMAKEPEDRYSDAESLLRDLAAALGDCEQKSVHETTTAKHGETVVHFRRLTAKFKRGPSTWILVASTLLVIAVLAIVVVSQRIGPSSAAPTPTTIVNGEHFLEMNRDGVEPDSAFERWTMNYPGIAQLRSANSGAYLAALVAGQEHRVDIWSRSGKRLLSERLPSRPAQLALSADSGRLAIALRESSSIRLWDTDKWRQRSPVSSTAVVDAVALSADGHWLAFTVAENKSDGAWLLWNVEEEKQYRRTVVRGAGRIDAIGFGQGQELRVITGGRDGTLRVWSALKSEEPPFEYKAGVAVHAMAMAPAREQVALGAGKYFSLWTYRPSRRDVAIPAGGVDVSCVAFDATGRQAAWAGADRVQWIDVESRRAIAEFQVQGARVVSLAFTSDATQLLAAIEDGRVLSWRRRK